MDNQKKEALAWLRFVLNPETAMPMVTDWKALLAFADRQALIGICMPFQCAEIIEQDLRLRWFGLCQMAESRYKLISDRIVQLFGWLEEAGLSCCLLKGHGNALLYPKPQMRAIGDIDVWIDADEEYVLQCLKNQFPDTEVSFDAYHKHIVFPIFEDIPVDLHTTPLKMYRPAFEKRLRQWIERNKEEQFRHKIRLPGLERDVNVPTCRFNAIFLLGHILTHVFDDGVGLRQMVDYFYVLKNLELSEKERAELAGTLKSLGMYRFARAVMWIESHALGLPEERCIMDPDESLGKRLLADILDGGNFGRYGQPFVKRHNRVQKFFLGAWRDISLLPMAPREGIARLCCKIRTRLTPA